MENKIKQLRKGILELAILGSLDRRSHYGYSLVKTIAGDGEITIAEGTIYPILNRLAKEELIKAQWVESSQGPPRKYYSLTDEGRRAFKVLNREFLKLTRMVANAGSRSDDPDRIDQLFPLPVEKEKNHGR